MKNIEISIIMGSKSDFITMQHACNILASFDIAYDTKIVSAHRTPKRLFEYCVSAKDNGIKVIIAGAGGSAHLPGMVAALTELPVLGVPVETKTLKGLDSLLSIVQMPAGIPVATFAIGDAGAKNAALSAISILALSNKKLAKKLSDFRAKQTKEVALQPN
jgi:5-(carboxyamino)imidazole ribonucleotide mutase